MEEDRDTGRVSTGHKDERNGSVKDLEIVLDLSDAALLPNLGGGQAAHTTLALHISYRDTGGVLLYGS